MNNYYKVGAIVCAVLLTLTTVLWFVFQAKHFLAAPDGIFFFGLGILFIILSLALVKISIKELREGR
jgi:hypothetical protein